MDPFVGEIRPFGFSFAPLGWAACNGQLLSIEQNPALYSILGASYGGNGQTNFALPNLAGSAPLGAGQGPGLSNYTVGQKGGSAEATLSQSQIPAHWHYLMVSSDPATQQGPANASLAKTAQPIYGHRGRAMANFSPQAVSATGAGEGHPNMQPYLVVNFCIALQGVFPPRP